jgi:hypothetical protein
MPVIIAEVWSIAKPEAAFPRRLPICYIVVT